MPMDKCEFCGHEQDTAVSRICDNCGRRMDRTRTDIKPIPEPAEEEGEAIRCPMCGVPSTKKVCPNCGAVIRKRGV